MTKKIKPNTDPISSPGLATSCGQILEEKHPRLQGREGMNTFQEMADNSATLSAALFAIEGFLRRICWRPVPASQDEAAKAEALFIKQCMDDMEISWSDMISDRLSMLVYGFDLSEIVYKYRRSVTSDSPRFKSKYSDGRIGWRTISTRKQTTIDRWDIDSEGNILGCWQVDSEYKEHYLPIERCMHLRTRTFANNPEGRSLLRGAFRSWHFNKRLEEVEAVGLVRSLVNLPHFQIPPRFMSPSASAGEKAVRATYERLASLISKDRLTGLVTPAEIDETGKQSGYKFTLVGAAGTQMSTDPVIRRYDARMMMVLAAEFMLLGSEKTGSFALAAEKSSNFKAALERFAGIIKDGLNKQIEKLMWLNGVPSELWPRLEHDPIAEVGLNELGIFLSQAAAGGFVTPTLNTENRLREKAQLPPIEEDEWEDAQEAKRLAEAPPEPTEPKEKPTEEEPEEE